MQIGDVGVKQYVGVNENGQLLLTGCTERDMFWADFFSAQANQIHLTKGIRGA